MSAIFGILRYDGGAISARDLERMSNTLRHRGPDGRKFVIDGVAGIGHCLMRVNREDSFEAQPIRDRTADLALVADCRIDNREELAEQFGLGGATLRDMPDSALVLRAYKEWGEECAKHLIGDFAFAVWDGRRRTLVLGRDHMGQCTIFYHRGENFLAFATEVKSLWALAEVPRQLLDGEIARFFYQMGTQRPEGRTRYGGIYAVPGGTIIGATIDGTARSHRYWEPHADPSHEGRDEFYYVEKYRGILSEAVACRLRRLSGPAALLNSAGFDTAAIAGLAGPVVTEQRQKLISLSWLGEESVMTTRGDIRPWIEACRRVMPHLDIRQLSRKSEHPFAGIEKVFANNDGPGTGAGKTSGYLFAEAAAAGARLIMDGYGGDYTLNPRGHGALARHLLRGQLRRFFSEFRNHVLITGQSPWLTLKHEIILMLLPRSVVRWQRYLRQKGAFALRTSSRRDIEGPYLKKLRHQNAADAQPGPETVPITAMRACIQAHANKIRRSPAAAGAISAAAHGLVLTRPFHDKRVVELGLAIPEDFYVKDGVNRYLARRALADIYPLEFQTRGRANEGALGDSAIMDDVATEELLAEAGHLAKNPKLSAYFDFERARTILAGQGPSNQTAKNKAALLRALLIARFIDWFSGSNSR